MTMMHPIWLFVLGSLAVWRITHLLAEEDGPWDLMARLRNRLGQSVAGRLLDCFYCLSLWVALLPAIGLGGSWRVACLYWFSLSAVACLLQRFSSAPQAATSTIQFLEGEASCAAIKSERR